MKYDVFISYSRKDFEEVLAIIEIIRKDIPDLTLWFDVTGIESGDEFEDKIITAIDNSSYVLFALSDNSLQSMWTKDEVMYAKNTDKKVIPILLQGAQLKGWFLFKFGRVDCIDYTDDLQQEKLLNNLSSWTCKKRNSGNMVSPEKISQLQEHAQVEPLCPCGSGKLFKDCHGMLSVVLHERPTSQEKTWKVGDYYDVDGKKGVVFWVDKTGKHGKIVSLDEVKLRWCTYREFNKQKQIGALSHRAGYENSNAVKHEDTWEEKYPSFSWCLNHGPHWYLPAYKELFELFKTEIIEMVNNTLGSYGFNRIQISVPYWSSTEVTSTEVFVMYKDRSENLFVKLGFDGCFPECDNIFSASRFKHEMYNVRAVSAF